MEEMEKDPLYGILTKIPADIKDQIDVLAQEQWKTNRPIMIQKISQIVGITMEDLEKRLLAADKKSKKKTTKISKNKG